MNPKLPSGTFETFPINFHMHLLTPRTMHITYSFWFSVASVLSEIFLSHLRDCFVSYSRIHNIWFILLLFILVKLSSRRRKGNTLRRSIDGRLSKRCNSREYSKLYVGWCTEENEQFNSLSCVVIITISYLLNSTTIFLNCLG